MLARQRSGLDRTDLARSTDLTPTAIADIETGQKQTSVLELARISESLGERAENLLTEPIPTIVAHRNNADPGEPSPAIDRAIERIVHAVEFVVRCAPDSDLKDRLTGLPVHRFPDTHDDAEALATQARHALGVTGDEPVLELSSRLAEIGVLSFSIDLGEDSADAGSVLLTSGAVALVNGALRTGRRRLALAHELGHVLVADDYSVDWRVDGSSASRERTVDRFARALLLPAAPLRALRDQWGASSAEVIRTAAVRTASIYRVDMSTLARRLLDLSLVDQKSADFIRSVNTRRADIVEHNLVVADELAPEELPRPYEAAVLRLYSSETLTQARALDLLFDTWDAGDLPPRLPRNESEIWQFVS